MSGNNGGPWGGGNRGGGQRPQNGRPNNGDRPRGPQRPQGPEDGPQIPDIDDLMKQGQDKLRVLMGGKGGNGGNGAGRGGSDGPAFTAGGIMLGALVAVGIWAWSSFYTVKPEEQSVELFLGECVDPCVGNPGLNFAPWPLVTKTILPVTREQTEDIGVGAHGSEGGLMLTGDENIVDIDFQVVWNINDPAKFLFNLRDARPTIGAVSESAMREIIAQSELAPILNRDRAAIASRLQDLIQSTLDSYNSGVTIVRVNFDKADPPTEVIDAFLDVQEAEQERDRVQKEADAYANRITAGARGQAAQVLEEAEAYRARVVNEAKGEASRFTAVLTEYQKSPEVTRKRLYLETMERVLGDVDKVIIDSDAGGQGVVPYLPINELRKNGGAN